MSRLSSLFVVSSVMLLSACATQDFVKESVAPVQASVDSLGTRVQAQDDSLKALDGRVQGSAARIQARCFRSGTVEASCSSWRRRGRVRGG